MNKKQKVRMPARGVKRSASRRGARTREIFHVWWAHPDVTDAARSRTTRDSTHCPNYRLPRAGKARHSAEVTESRRVALRVPVIMTRVLRQDDLLTLRFAKLVRHLEQKLQLEFAVADEHFGLVR